MKKILTESNIKKLQEELEYRMTVRRAEIAKEKLEYRMTVRRAEIAKEKLIAAAHGDRSENAEYKAACEEYRENDNRIQHLLTLITTSTVIEDERMDKSVIGINTKAKIKFIDDDFEDIVTIVTTLDAKPEDMLISIESDLGKALAGKRAGDVVEVMAPGESYKVEILEIL